MKPSYTWMVLLVSSLVGACSGEDDETSTAATEQPAETDEEDKPVRPSDPGCSTTRRQVRALSEACGQGCP